MDIRITEQDFDVATEYLALRKAAPHAGAIVFFVGLVRDFYAATQDSDESIEHLQIEHYPAMTEALCQEIIDEAKQRFSFDAARVVHRVGRIEASDQIVMVAVASAHRDDSFAASEFIMDYLKTRATFWKKEVGTQGEHWLGLKQSDRDAAQRWQAGVDKL